MARFNPNKKNRRDPSEVTAVIFRRWKRNKVNGTDGTEIVALFPEDPTDYYGRYCGSYEHIGQHGSADYNALVSVICPPTVPAKPSEYAELKRELESLGYKLKVYKKRTQEIMNNFRKGAMNSAKRL